MKAGMSLLVLATTVSLGACATRPAANESGSANTAAPSAQASVSTRSPAPQAVTAKNGVEGEIIGTPAPGSKFAQLRIGMRMREVTSLIGAPYDMLRHETGKRWIPFYFGNDAQRLQVLYKDEGCLTYTGGNVFGGGSNELIRITVDPKGECLDT